MEEEEVEEEEEEKESEEKEEEEEEEDLEEEEEEDRRQKAAVTIQAAVKGFLCRKQGILVKHCAATLLQSVWLGSHAQAFT